MQNVSSFAPVMFAVPVVPLGRKGVASPVVAAENARFAAYKVELLALPAGQSGKAGEEKAAKLRALYSLHNMGR